MERFHRESGRVPSEYGIFWSSQIGHFVQAARDIGDGLEQRKKRVDSDGGTDMKLWWRLAFAGLAGMWLIGVTAAVRPSAQAQMTAPIQGKKAGEFFKNVST